MVDPLKAAVVANLGDSAGFGSEILRSSILSGMSGGATFNLSADTDILFFTDITTPVSTNAGKLQLRDESGDGNLIADLGGHTLTFRGTREGVTLANALTLKNGTIIYGGTAGTSAVSGVRVNGAGGASLDGLNVLGFNIGVGVLESDLSGTLSISNSVIRATGTLVHDANDDGHGVHIQGGMSGTLSVTNSTIRGTGNNSAGIGFAGVGVDITSTGALLITGSNVSAAGGAGALGAAIEFNGSIGGTVTIDRSTIKGIAPILPYGGVASGAAVTIRESTIWLTQPSSKFIGSTFLGFTSGPGIIDASQNWWTLDGVTSATPAQVNARINVPVDFTPMLALQPTVAGADFSALIVHPFGQQVDPGLPSGDPYLYGDFSAANQLRIDEAIQLLDDGGRIDVAAGTYRENVQIDRPLTLAGPNDGVDPNVFGRGAEAIIEPDRDGSATVHVFADDVTIDGFTIRRSTPSGRNSIPGATSDWGIDNLYPPEEDADSVYAFYVPVNGLTVRDNIITGAGLSDAPDSDTGGVKLALSDLYGFDASGFTMEDNRFVANRIVDVGAVGLDLTNQTSSEGDLGVQILDNRRLAATAAREPIPASCCAASDSSSRTPTTAAIAGSSPRPSSAKRPSSAIRCRATAGRWSKMARSWAAIRTAAGSSSVPTTRP